jgi:hypothetical protein
LDHITLTNKANLWQSNDTWKFLQNGTLGMYIIENTSKSKVLEVANNSKVNEEEFDKDSPKQLWERGVTDSAGYFSLKNSESTFLTAVSAVALEIKGTMKKYRIL